MPENWRELRASPRRMAHLLRQEPDEIPDSMWIETEQLLGNFPTRQGWLRFIDFLLIALGVVFIVAGVTFFFAYNWVALGKFGRFILLESIVILATILAFVFNFDSWGGRLSLFAAAFFIGINFAIAGQTYQSGADSYNLFLNWMLLITGWVLISRWNVMYFMWMVLLNLTVILYWYQVIDTNYELLNFILVFVNYGFIIGWELVALQFPDSFMQAGRWLLYILMIPALVFVTFHMLDFIYDFGVTQVTMQGWGALIYAGVLLSYGAFYTLIRRDLLMITMLVGSVIFVITAFFAQFFIEPLLIALVILGQTTLAAMGLRRLQNQWEADEQ